MSPAKYAAEVTAEIRALMNNPHPPPDNDTQDDREWPDLTDSERRARLAALSHEELVTQYMLRDADASLAEATANFWHRKCEGLLPIKARKVVA